MLSLSLHLPTPIIPSLSLFCLLLCPQHGLNTDISGLTLVAASQSSGSELALLQLPYTLGFRNEMSSQDHVRTLVPILWHYFGRWQKHKQVEPCWKKQITVRGSWKVLPSSWSHSLCPCVLSVIRWAASYVVMILCITEPRINGAWSNGLKAWDKNVLSPF